VLVGITGLIGGITTAREERRRREG